MSDKLAAGARLKTLYGEAVVQKWLAEGGQGDVYQVKYNGQDKALKWYKPGGMGKDKDRFYKNLKSNVMHGAPDASFLWPLDITEPDKDGIFGYIMDLRPEGYYEVSSFMLTKVRFQSYRTVVDASLKIVSAYRILHNLGYSYQDLNDGNFFINPKTGDVRIGDNDNVAPNGTETGIIGKPRYMAPEIVTRKKSKPDTLSDLYSMSVILFILFFLTHPLEGKRSLAPALTPQLQDLLYGKEPLFIMDPENQENGPDPAIHKNVLNVWPSVPDYVRELFLQAFSQKALHNGNLRPTEIDWMKTLVRFRSEIVLCPCGNNVFFQEGRPCEKCGRMLHIPTGLDFGSYRIPATGGSRLYKCQFGPCKVDEALNPVGFVSVEANRLVLRNVSDRSWDAVSPSGKAIKIRPDQKIPLNAGGIFTVTLGSGEKTVKIVEY